jgi:energy-coupling factor transport system permease protein
VVLADLTLGRFYGVESFIHRLDARTKFLVALASMGCCLFARNVASFMLLYAFLGAAILLSRVPIRYTLRNLRFFVWLLLFAILLNLFFTEGRSALEYGALSVTYEGMAAAGVALGRLVFVVMTASLLTLTTPPLDLTEGISHLFGFLSRLRVPVRGLGLMSALSLSFLPILVDEARTVSMAQKARGAVVEGRNLRVLKSAISLLAPVIMSTLRKADNLALAMESRCFRTAGERTSLARSEMGRSDALTLIVALILMIAATLLAR